MEDAHSIETAKSATYQLIGQNVLLLQQYELLLKALLPKANLTHTRPAASKSPPSSNFEKNQKAVAGSTLGTLVSRYIREVLNPEEPECREDPGETNILFSIRHHFNAPADREAKEAKLLKLVQDRNHLIHQLLENKQLSTAEDWLALHSKLEDLAKRLCAEIEFVKQSLKEAQLFTSALKDPEILREFIYTHSRNLLVDQLRSSAGQSSDPDGWTVLKDALQTHAPACDLKIPELCQAYQVKSLTALLQVFGGFELRHASPEDSHSRTYYRLLPETSSNQA